jgi:AraC-like DNA-binding protein
VPKENVLEVLYLGVAVLAYLNILYEIGRRYNPELFEQLKQAIEKQRVSRLAGLDLKKLHFELIELMTSDKIYMDAKLTLARLADELDVKPHQLSEFLNKRMQTNFNRFINQFRIEKVVKLIMEDPSLNILDVAFNCGFSSKTAFNTAFVNLKGMPPGRYIELKREQWSAVSSKS